jgi:RNA polymerase sigma-70 factor, ECF subfamily
MVGLGTKRPDERAMVAGLVQEHGGALIAYATRLTGDRYAAEDVVQETLVRAWQHPEVLENGKGSVRGWLLTVARNIVIDQARARASRPKEVATSPAADPISGDHADSVVNTMTMMGLLGELPVDQQRVLVEMYYRGRTVTEVAAALGIPAGTVKSRLFYALRTLRHLVASTGTVAHDEADTA